MTYPTEPTGRDFTWLVNDFVDRVPGVTHALVLSSDGLLLTASASVGPERAEQMAAISAGMLSLSANGAALFGAGSCEQIIVRLNHGYLLFMAIDAGAGLATLTSRDCDMKTVGYEMTQFVLSAGHALTARVRTDLRQVLGGHPRHAAHPGAGPR